MCGKESLCLAVCKGQESIVVPHHCWVLHSLCNFTTEPQQPFSFLYQMLRDFLLKRDGPHTHIQTHKDTHTHLQQKGAQPTLPPPSPHYQQENLHCTSQRSITESQETATPSHHLLWPSPQLLSLSSRPTGLQKLSLSLSKLTISLHTSPERVEHYKLCCGETLV